MVDEGKGSDQMKKTKNWISSFISNRNLIAVGASITL